MRKYKLKFRKGSWLKEVLKDAKKARNKWPGWAKG